MAINEMIVKAVLRLSSYDWHLKKEKKFEIGKS